MHRRDYYYQKAKEENYRSRAAYKLLQTISKYNFMKPRDIVVDLGAAPGGWLQVASKTVGEQGIVLGIDLKQIEPLTDHRRRSRVRPRGRPGACAGVRCQVRRDRCRTGPTGNQPWDCGRVGRDPAAPDRHRTRTGRRPAIHGPENRRARSLADRPRELRCRA